MNFILLGQFELVERATQMNSYLLVIILLCFTFIGVARVAQPDLIKQSFLGFFKMKRIDNAGFEGNKLQPSITALIILNYLVSLGICTFLIFVKEKTLITSLSYSALFVGALSFLQILSFRLISWLSGEKIILEIMSTVNKQVWSFGGFLFLSLSLLWVLNQELQSRFEGIFSLLLLSLVCWRLIKGLRLALQLRYRWYYLILYLCTLEILPLFILVKLAWEYFDKMV